MTEFLLAPYAEMSVAKLQFRSDCHVFDWLRSGGVLIAFARIVVCVLLWLFQTLVVSDDVASRMGAVVFLLSA